MSFSEGEIDELSKNHYFSNPEIEALRIKFLHAQKEHSPTSKEYRDKVYDFLWHIDRKYRRLKKRRNESPINQLKNFLKGNYKLKNILEEANIVLQTLCLVDLIKPHCPVSHQLIDNPVLSLVLSLPHDSRYSKSNFHTLNGDFTLRLSTSDESTVPSGRLGRMMLLYILKTSWNYSGLYSKNSLSLERLTCRREGSISGNLKAIMLEFSEKGVIDIGSNISDFLEEIGYRGKQPNRKKFNNTVEGFKHLRVDYFHTNENLLPFPASKLRSLAIKTNAESHDDKVFHLFLSRLGEQFYYLFSDQLIDIFSSQRKNRFFLNPTFQSHAASNIFYVNFGIIMKLESSYSIDLMLLASFTFLRVDKSKNITIKWKELIKLNGGGSTKHHYKEKIKKGLRELKIVWPEAKRIHIINEGVMFKYVHDYRVAGLYFHHMKETENDLDPDNFFGEGERFYGSGAYNTIIEIASNEKHFFHYGAKNLMKNFPDHFRKPS